MGRRKSDDAFALSFTAVALSIIAFLLIALLLAFGREMVVRLNAQITEGVREF